MYFNAYSLLKTPVSTTLLMRSKTSGNQPGLIMSWTEWPLTHTK